MGKPLRRHALLALGVLSLSTAAILLRLYRGHPLTAAGWRLFFLTPWAVRRIGELRALPRRSLLVLTGAGAALAAHFTLVGPCVSERPGWGTI
ncbi:MAG: hypothetical protein GX493_07165 [Firmicutes bacterium]|nr:hypothetical protein [Bacillota bacterium]